MKLSLNTRTLIALAALALAAPVFAQGGKMACKDCQGAKSAKAGASGKRDACAIPYTIAMKGLHCEGCAATITDSLKAVKGVEEVTVDPKTQKATVWVCSHKNVKPAALKSAVVKAGYQVVSVAKAAK